MHCFVLAEAGSLTLVLIAGVCVWLVSRVFSGYGTAAGLGFGALLCAAVVFAGVTLAWYTVAPPAVGSYAVHREQRTSSGSPSFSAEFRGESRRELRGSGGVSSFRGPGAASSWSFSLPVFLGAGVLLMFLLRGQTRAGTLSFGKILIVVVGTCWLLSLGFRSQLQRAGSVERPDEIAGFVRPDLPVDQPAASLTAETPHPPAASPPATAPAAAESVKPRPAWLALGEGREGNTYHMVVSSGRYSTQLECDRMLGEEMKHAAQRYLESYLGEGAVEAIAVDPAYVKDHVQRSEFSEVVETSVGPMHEVHALLEFDDQAQVYFREQWRDALVSSRMWRTGLAATSVLGVVAAVFGYLKLDLLTAGRHRARLGWAALLAVAFAGAGAGMLLIR